MMRGRPDRLRRAGGRLHALISGASANTAACSDNGPVWVGRSGGKIHRAAIAIPDSASVVDDDKLVIGGWIDYRVLSRSTSATSELEVYGLKRDIADGATWNRATPTVSWTTPGGDLPAQRESKRSLAAAQVGRRVVQVIPRYLQREVENRPPSNAILIKSTNESVEHLDGLEDFTVNINWHDRYGLGSQYSFEHLELPGGMGADVNLGNGNLVLRQPGPALSGFRGRPLASRFWNSYASGYVNTYGNGEEGDFGSIAIEELPDHSSLLYGFSGIEGVFVQRHDGSFEAPAGIPAVMREQPDGSYTLFFEDTNETWTFSAADPHRLVRAEDAYGHVLEAEYDNDGDIVRLTGSDGTTIEYGAFAEGEPTLIKGPDGSIHRYIYEADSDLATYTAPGGAVTRFTRDSDDRMRVIEWADGSVLEIEYAGDWWPELTLTGPGGRPVTALEFGGSATGPGFTDVYRNADPIRRFMLEPGLFAVYERRLPSPVTTLALSGRLATGANTTLAPGVHPLTFAAGDAGGVARVDIEVDGSIERTWTWDCTVSCARSQSATWNLNTADFPPGDHVVRVIATAAGGERRAEAVRVTVAYSATVISPRTRMQPTIAGRAADGETLTASTGTWIGAHPIAFQPQWRRCNATGAACQDIAGENDWRYTATGADIGSTLVVTVRGRNARGVGTSSSAAFGRSPAARRSTCRRRRCWGGRT
jgi:YD repeat-containing protein